MALVLSHIPLLNTLSTRCSHDRVTPCPGSLERLGITQNTPIATWMDAPEHIGDGECGENNAEYEAVTTRQILRHGRAVGSGNVPYIFSGSRMPTGLMKAMSLIWTMLSD